MYALITGASSGMGRDMARLLAKRGYSLIITGRNKKALNDLAAELKEVKVLSIPLDLSKRKNCFRLYHILKDMPVDVVVNNAGFGIYGEMYKTDINRDMELINLNICAVHILTKLFLRKMLRENHGYILNVSSLAAFAPGPMMSAYYASKAYVLKLTCAVDAEIRHSKRRVHISAFCPGPVATDFNNRAGVNFSIRPISSRLAAERAINGMFGGERVIFPRLRDRITAAAGNIAPLGISGRVCMCIQRAKGKER